jgi:hypothetical protein
MTDLALREKAEDFVQRSCTDTELTRGDGHEVF